MRRWLLLSACLHAAVIGGMAIVHGHGRHRVTPARFGLEPSVPSPAAAPAPRSPRVVREPAPEPPPLPTVEPVLDFGPVLPPTAPLPERPAPTMEPVWSKPAEPRPDVEAVPLAAGNRPPGYPPASVLRGEHGTVKVRVQVAADGTVVSVELAEPCRHPLLNRAAVRAVQQWRFEPARAAGVPVPSVVVVPVVFRLPGR